MNTHPYLRAYMAGIFAPTLGLLVALTVFTITRLVYHVPIPIERVLVFPMALVPNLFGIWNMLYVLLRSRRHLPIGIHGAALPFLIAPLGFTVARALGVVIVTSTGLLYFNVLTIPYSILATLFPIGVVVYYLVWKHVVGFLNELLGIA